MIRYALTALSDTGLRTEINSIPKNDLLSIKKIIEYDKNNSADLIDRNEVFKVHEYDALFIHYGGLVNFGGVQSKHAIELINVINEFKGPVIIFSNDVMNGIDNPKRDGFVRITRPVIYADPKGEIDPTKTKGLEIIKSITINQTFPIGKFLSEQERVVGEPVYQAIYGGRARPAMFKILKKVASKCDLVTYHSVAKKIPGSITLKHKKIFSNLELTAVTSLGCYSFIFYEEKKTYFTSRVFEQLFSNSIVLFDTRYKVFSMFWNEHNTFSNEDELLQRLSEPWSWERVKAQHKMASEFDFDKNISEECEQLNEVVFWARQST